MQLAFAFYSPFSWSPKDEGLKLLQIQDRLRRLSGVKLSDSAVFVALCWFSGAQGCFPSHESLADRSGLSLSTVKRSLERLRAEGLVSWTRQSRERGNRYRFHRPELFRIGPKLASSSRHTPTESRATPGKAGTPAAARISGPSLEGQKIAQNELSKSLKLTSDSRGRESEARSSERAKHARDAEPVRNALEEALGTTLPKKDPLPGAMAELGARSGAPPELIAAWIGAKAAGRRDIRGFGFFLHAMRAEFDDWSREQIDHERSEAERKRSEHEEALRRMTEVSQCEADRAARRLAS